MSIKGTDVTTLVPPDELDEFRRGLGLPDETPPKEPAWPTLDPIALHGLAGDIVRTIEPHTEADPVALLIQFLAAFGNAASRNAYFQIEADKHFPNLFAVLIGDSSKARKGTSQSHVKMPFSRADEVWAATRCQSGLSSGEGVIWAVRDPIEKREPIKDRGRVTDYQDVVTDAGVEDKRLYLVEAEFAGTLRVLGRDGSTLSPVLRNAWDTGDLQVLTKNSPAKATGAHVSIIGHITADELRRYLDRTEAGNGFANRFLWCCVRRSKCLPEGGNIGRENLDPIIRGLRSALDYARPSQQLRFDEAARTVWHRVYPELSAGQPGLLGAVTARAEAQVIRLALIYALLDCSPDIKEPHLLAALGLWEYCLESAAFVFGDATGDPTADDILLALRRSPSGMTRTEISSSLFGRHKPASEIGRALTLLSKAGKIRAETLATEGRTAEVWYVVR